MVDWSFCGAKIARAGSQLVPPFVVREKIASPRKRRGSEQDELALFEHYGVPYTDQGTGTATGEAQRSAGSDGDSYDRRPSMTPRRLRGGASRRHRVA